MIIVTESSKRLASNIKWFACISAYEKKKEAQQQQKLLRLEVL